MSTVPKLSDAMTDRKDAAARQTEPRVMSFVEWVMFVGALALFSPVIFGALAVVVAILKA